MSRLTLNERNTPATPATDKVELYCDAADEKIKAIDDLGFIAVLTPDGWRDKNFIINGGMIFAQRQDPTALTSYAANANRVFAFDQWALSAQTSSLQAQRIDTLGAFETGLTARYYHKLKQITGAGKIMLSQVIEGMDCSCLRGQTVRFQVNMKYTTLASASKFRLGLVILGTGGTIDTITNPWTTAWGSNSTDPTLGANLTYQAPTLAYGGTVNGNAADITLTTAWTTYAGIFTIPSSARNIIPVIWSDSQLSINDEVNISECQLNIGQEPRIWIEWPVAVEYERCARFFCKTFNIDTLPANSLAATTGGIRGILGKTGSGTALGSILNWRFPVSMRAAPAITMYTLITTGALVYRITGTTPAVQGTTATANITEQGVDITATNEATTNGAVGDQVGIHAIADSGL